MWWKGDDGWWSHPKLQQAGRSGRGLLADLLAYTSDHRTDGFMAIAALGKVDATPADPDIKKLLKIGMLHRRGDACRCIDKRGFEWPAERGYVIHDYLDYNPSREENDVARAQRAELRDPGLRAAVRSRDFGRCRFCGIQTNSRDRRGDTGETLDHIDPAIAAGADNLVIACRACNSAKKKRTPEQALMVLLEVADVRAKHFGKLGIPDPDLAHDSEPTQVEEADGPGRVGTGSGRDGRHQIGPPTTRRDSEHPNPYTRAGHGDPALEPPPPQTSPSTDPPPPRTTNRRSQRPRKRKGRR